MPKFFIGFGECSKYYLYILGTVIFKCLRDCMFGFNNINPESKIGLFGFIPKLSHHHLIQSLYRYIGFIFGGALFTCILKKNIAGEKDTKNKNKQNLKLKTLIYNDGINGGIKKNKKDILIVCLIYCIHSELSRIMYLFDFGGLDLWTFDILFIILFMDIYFIIDFYRHQKLSISFIIISDTILLLVSSFLPYTDHQDIEKNNIKDYNTYKIIEEMTGNNYSFIFAFLSFIFLSCILSYGRIKKKVLMDFYYLSPYNLIFYMGIFGFIITSFILTITTKFNCSEERTFIKNHCYVTQIENNVTKYYYDNIKVYYNQLKNEKKDYKFLLEIIFIPPLFFIISFLEFSCEILIINNLNPIYVLIRDNIYYGISRLIFFLFNLNKNYKQYMTLTQFIILEIAEFIAIFGYAVYFELIELRFLGLDVDLKKNIIKRGARESLLKSIDTNGDENKDYDESFLDESSKNTNRYESNEDEF